MFNIDKVLYGEWHWMWAFKYAKLLSLQKEDSEFSCRDTLRSEEGQQLYEGAAL